MMKNVKFSVLLALIPLLAGCPVHFGLITGAVTDLATGEPIEGAVISTNGIGYAISDAEGNYYLNEMAGTWVMETRAEGYAPFSVGVTVNAGETVVLDITLDPIATTTTTAITTTTVYTSTTTIASTTTTICQYLLIYGENSEEVALLRGFRDNVLRKTPEGRELINLSYEWGPVIVKLMEGDEEFKKEVKEIIDRVLLLLERKRE